MATYETRESNSSNTIQYILKELYLYGSNRLGYINLGLAIQNPTSPFSELPAPGSQFFSVSGFKNYELTNHLGNVLSVVSDDAPTSQQSDLVCSNDYFPFGSQMPERSFSSGVYRFGFNGKENDNEMKGDGNSVDFGARIYDSRIGKWFSIDKSFTKFASWSPYKFAKNNPLVFIDPDGNTDFWFEGRWIGTDGRNNQTHAIITDKKLVKFIEKQTAEGLNFNIGAVDFEIGEGDWTFVHQDILAEAYSNLLFAITVGKTKEQTMVLTRTADGCYERVFMEIGKEDGKGELKSRGDVSIHSHPNEIDKDGANSTTKPSSKIEDPINGGDLENVFPFYEMNIITGLEGEVIRYDPIKGSDVPTFVDRRVPTISIYDKGMKPRVQITQTQAEKMLLFEKGEAGKKFEEKRNENNNPQR